MSGLVGMYLWENNYERAMEWATQKYGKPPDKVPAVIGAVIDRGYCCDMLETKFIKMVQAYYDLMVREYKALNKALPENKYVSSDPHGDKLMRRLDCATLQFMQSKINTEIRKDLATTGYSRYKIFDSVRGMFSEGGKAYEGSEFYKKSHTQICIRNPNCIKGYFLKREEIDFFQKETAQEPIATHTTNFQI